MDDPAGEIDFRKMIRLELSGRTHEIENTKQGVGITTRRTPGGNTKHQTARCAVALVEKRWAHEHGIVPRCPNPNGVLSLSPAAAGLRGTSYPGLGRSFVFNPEGVAAL
jgi:hypothetical protein